MPFFLHQVSYTPEALARLIANPQDRFDAVRAPIEKLGGRVLNSYFAFGQYDAVLITEMPDNVSAAAIALAFAAGGSLRNYKTTTLMSNAEGLEAMRRAASCGYKPVQAAASAAAAPLRRWRRPAPACNHTRRLCAWPPDLPRWTSAWWSCNCATNRPPQTPRQSPRRIRCPA